MKLVFLKKPTGRILYYPKNVAAKELVAAFSNSRGQRKCITEEQLKILMTSGLKCVILQS